MSISTHSMSSTQLDAYRAGILQLITDSERHYHSATTPQLQAYHSSRVHHLLDALAECEQAIVAASPNSLEMAQYQHDMARVGEW